MDKSIVVVNEVRPCFVKTFKEGYPTEEKAIFHNFTVYGDTIIELEDGKCITTNPINIRFVYSKVGEFDYE